MRRAGIQPKGILRGAGEKTARRLARVALLGGTAIKQEMPAWSKQYGFFCPNRRRGLFQEHFCLVARESGD
jgi:hypothetical protein